MDSVKGKGKKNMAVKAWERCRVICRGAKKSAVNPFSPWSSFSKSKPSKRSEVDKPKTKSPVPPKGYFPVYVGAQKQRFVIKTQFANHSLFQMLLEETEQEYGYSNEGPVLLPCEVDTFNKVLAEMNSGDQVHFECSRWIEYNDQLLPDGDHTNTEISHIGKSLGPPRNRNTLSSGFGFYAILNSIVWNAAVDEYVH